MSQYIDLQEEIKEVQQKIKKLESDIRKIESDGNVVDSVSGGCGGTEHFRIEGFPYPEYSRKRTLLYDYTDVVNACGLSYARLYSEIEQRYENEQYYKVDGTPLTKEDEIEWLDIQFEQEAAWQKSCARIAAQGQVIQGKIFEMPTKEMEELEDSFYQAKDAYMKLYRESRQVGKPLVLQNYIFGNGRMYEVLNRLGNLQERVE